MPRFLRLLLCLALLAAVAGCVAQESGDIFVVQGGKMMRERNFTGAIAQFNKALEMPLSDYSQGDVYTMLGNCYNELDDLDEAIRYHEMALAENPKDHRVHVNIGVVYRLKGDLDEAERCYQKALELAPEYPELHASLGALYLFRKEHDKSIEFLERAAKLDDSLAIAHSNLAIAYASVGRFADADASLERAIDRGYHQPEKVRALIDELRNNPE